MKQAWLFLPTVAIALSSRAEAPRWHGLNTYFYTGSVCLVDSASKQALIDAQLILLQSPSHHTDENPLQVGRIKADRNGCFSKAVIWRTIALAEKPACVYLTFYPSDHRILVIDPMETAIKADIEYALIPTSTSAW